MSSGRMCGSSAAILLAVAAVGGWAGAADQAAPAPGSSAESVTEAIARNTPWRVFLVCGYRENQGRGKMVYTPPPPTNWAQADFDDSIWGRCGDDLYETIGGYGFRQNPVTAVLCLRTAFGIADPARVGDLTLDLEYRGGVAVYVNGQELGRQHLPEGPLTEKTPAAEYPPDAFTTEDGKPLDESARPPPKRELGRNESPVRRDSVTNGQESGRQPQAAASAKAPAEKRPADPFASEDEKSPDESLSPPKKAPGRHESVIRRYSVKVPASVLRKGANTLALRIHRVPMEGVPLAAARQENEKGWSSAGLCDVSLSSVGGPGVIAYTNALKEVTFSNAMPMDTVGTAPGKRQWGFLWWGIAVTQAPLTRGNPFEPLRPIRTVAPRGGTCSGQIVVSGPEPISGVKASLGPMKHVAKDAVMPAEAVRVCYAMQDAGEVYCNALMPQPIDGAAVQPVWVLIDVPRNQTPGWYTGMLTVTAGAKTAAVPVQVLVSGWTLTDPKDNATLLCMYQSPETLASYYKVEPWSDRHFALIEKSFQSMALAGNDVLLVPVIIDSYLGHKNGLVRWVRKGNGFEPEFALLEKYLDLHTKVFGKPKVVTLSIWKQQFGARTWFRGAKNDKVGPCMVTELDPATGQMKPLQAPHFGEPGSEEFWKPMIEGVRRIIKARGCDDRFLLLGEPFDSRPLEPVVEFFKKIEPEMRWQIYSHYDGGEPKPKDGKFICHGGFEVGFRIDPNGTAYLPEFYPKYPKVETQEFLQAGAGRCDVQYTSSPLSYRTLMRGAFARIGLDFWFVGTDARGRRSSLYGCPPGEGWLWRAHVPTLTAPGPDGAVRTTRAQMFLEGVQQCEVNVALIRARAKAPPETVTKINASLAQRGQRYSVAGVLPQAAMSQDIYAGEAGVYEMAAQLAGEACDGQWDRPPPAQEGGK